MPYLYQILKLSNSSFRICVNWHLLKGVRKRLMYELVSKDLSLCYSIYCIAASSNETCYYQAKTLALGSHICDNTAASAFPIPPHGTNIPLVGWWHADVVWSSHVPVNKSVKFQQNVLFHMHTCERSRAKVQSLKEVSALKTTRNVS